MNQTDLSKKQTISLAHKVQKLSASGAVDLIIEGNRQTPLLAVYNAFNHREWIFWEAHHRKKWCHVDHVSDKINVHNSALSQTNKQTKFII
jgi:hypothetical protein